MLLSLMCQELHSQLLQFEKCLKFLETFHGAAPVLQMYVVVLQCSRHSPAYCKSNISNHTIFNIIAIQLL